ncbi:HNH endonuclease signature motif containing protein [Leisingera sp. JC11]|uniref:HNH endonuclease n=1 Tax=Leisingera sp. JC11 TaxID=3042469 RepID=UPI0034550744
MTRPVKEWIGKAETAQAPARVKARIIMAQDGLCGCGCGVKLGAAGEAIEFDHETALILGGENRESNLRALRRPCHRAKTNADVAQKSVEARKRAKHLGLLKTGSTIPGSKNTKWKKKITGEVVRR